MLPLVNDAFLTLTPYVPGKPIQETERELGLTGVVKLASNESPYGPSPKAVAAMQAVLAGVSDYPDGGAFHLRQAIAEKHGVEPRQVVLGAGTSEIIEMVIRTCLRPDENMLYADPSFVMYALAAQAAGRKLRRVPLTADLRYDLPALAKAADHKTKLIFIGNPNNPTGTYVSRRELEAFLGDIAPDVVVVMDEAYFEYAVASDYPNGLDYVSRRDRLLVLRTFSKCHGLAGLRVGYGVGDPELVDYLNRGRQPFNVNTLAQVAGLAALEDDAHVERTARQNRVEMARLTPALRARGLTVHDSQANFLLVDFGKSAEEIFAKLLRQGVIVRPMGAYGLATMARITIGTPAQDDKLLAAIEQVLR